MTELFVSSGQPIVDPHHQSETAALIRAHDWAMSPIGNPATWPAPLRSAITLMIDSLMPVWLAWGPELTFLYNDAYRPILGSKHPSALGRPLAEVWAEIWAEVEPLVVRTQAGEPIVVHDLPLRVHRGPEPEDAFFTFSYTPLRDDAGEVQGIFCAVSETTAGVVAQQEAARARDVAGALNETLEKRVEERTAQRDRMWNISPDLMVEASLDGVYSRANPAWQILLGFSPEEVVGRTAEFFTHPDDIYSMRDALAVVQADTLPSVNLRFRHKDGGFRWIQWVAAPSHGQIFAFGRDVTAATEADALLRRTEDQLRQAQKMEAVGQLTGGIAHDFNNLLTVISGAAEMLRRPDLAADKRARYIDNIAETAKRASTLTSHLLAVSRRRTIQPEVVELNLLLDALGEVLSRSLGSHIRVVVIPSTADAHVEVDPTEFETAILNAAVNARDAMPDGGELTLAIKEVVLKNTTAVAVEISDTGTGMTPETIERVFEPFFTTKPVGVGTGLGLSQIHGFAAQAGGMAEVHSKVGVGTTIRILLPGSDKRPVSVRPHAELAEIPRGLRVLLVEDNLQVLQFAEQLLRDLGSEVMIAHNGAEALGLLQEHPFDLVFTDVVMPGLSGIDLARQLHIRAPDIPVLLATGYSEQMVSEGAGPFLVLAKPYGAETLSNAIKKLLPRDTDS